jgi:hypothetical protein
MKSKLPVGRLIKERMESDGHSVAWLAKRMYCDRSNIYKIFQKQSLDTETLFLVSRVMKVDFFAYYSNNLQADSMQNP